MSEEQKSAIELAREKAEAEATAENAKRVTTEGDKVTPNKGTRVMVGATRGKNPQIISFEQFDDSIPESLPTSITEFAQLVKVTDEKVMVDYLIRGYNAASYEAASDPLAEFIPGKWPQDAQNTFRLAVRGYSRGVNIPLEEAVNIIRPGFVAKFGE